MSLCCPGMPCYGQNTVVNYTYPYGSDCCQTGPYRLPLRSEDVYYSGANLPYTGIQTAMLLTEAIQRIDAKFSPEELIDAFIEAIQNNPTLKSALCAEIGTC